MIRVLSGSRRASKRRSAVRDVVRGIERLGERQRVLGRLRHASADMRARHERGIAQDGDPAEGHARHCEIVDRLQERLRRAQDRVNGGAITLSPSWRISATRRARSAAAGSRQVGQAALVGQEPRQLALLARRPIQTKL